MSSHPAPTPARTDPTPDAECLHCGRAIDATIARVVGDNDNCVQRCKDCAEGYSRTVVAAQAARGDGLRVAAKGRRGGGE